MLPAHRNELTVILARIDQIIAEAESHVVEPDIPGDIERIEDVLQDCRRARVVVEGYLRANNG